MSKLSSKLPKRVSSASWNPNPPLPRYAYGRIIADCVDCGEETWWLRGRSADGGNSTVATGRDYRVGYLLSNDPDLPIPDEPRCYDCTAYRALPPNFRVGVV